MITCWLQPAQVWRKAAQVDSETTELQIKGKFHIKTQRDSIYK